MNTGSQRKLCFTPTRKVEYSSESVLRFFSDTRLFVGFLNSLYHFGYLDKIADCPLIFPVTVNLISRF